MKMLAHLFILAFLVTTAWAAFHPLSEADKVAVRELFPRTKDGFTSLEEAYQTVRSFQVLGDNTEGVACDFADKFLISPSNEIKQIFYAVKIAEISGCQVQEADLKEAISNAKLAIKKGDSLLDLYYGIGALVTIKDQKWNAGADLVLDNPTNIFATIKELGQPDGTWKFGSSESESSAKATGLALETLAGLIKLTGPDFEREKIKKGKVAASKLFDKIESYDDGSQYFEEKKVDAITGSDGLLAANSHVVRGLMTFAAVAPGKIQIASDKIVGMAKFFLSVGVPGSAMEAYLMLDALAHLEENSLTVPLVLSLTSPVLSLRKKNPLEVSVTTVLGSAAAATVTLLTATTLGSIRSTVATSQVLEPVAGSCLHRFDLLGADKIDIGQYSLGFEVSATDAEKYSTGGSTQFQVSVTGLLMLTNVEVAVLDSDTGSPEFSKKLDTETRETVALSANHLQKFRLKFDLVSPLGEPMKPHQAILKLKHESGTEHLYLVKTTGKQLGLTLDFLGLVEKLYYQSGTYSIELILGDAIMENSILWKLGSIDIDLPEPPEGAAKPPAPTVDVASKFGPQAEISHIFRIPEKLPPAHLSHAFLVLTIIPLLGFIFGLCVIGANIKSMPSSGMPLFSTIAFHAGIAAVLGLYLAFWIQLDLFTTLKYLGLLGIFLVVSGHQLLSYMADFASKVKTA